PGHMINIPVPTGLTADRLLVLGRGTDGEGDSEAAWRDRGGSLFARLAAADVSDVAVILDEPGLTPRLVAALAAGARLRSYRFEKHQTRKPNHKPLDLTLVTDAPRDIEPALHDALAVADGTILARDLVNEPANILGPQEIAAVAQGLSEIGVLVEILTEDDMARLGMGALLAVGQGSRRPPRLVVMQWRGGRKVEAPLAFVGKGIVFDTGGISIKGAANMEAMKGD